MYQSVGHDAIESIAKCFWLSLLYRHPVRGTPRIWHDTFQLQEDEVEDL